MRALLRFHESVFLQVERGLLEERDLALYAFRNQGAYLAPGFEAWWRALRGGFHPDFVRALEQEYGLEMSEP